MFVKSPKNHPRNHPKPSKVACISYIRLEKSRNINPMIGCLNHLNHLNPFLVVFQTLPLAKPILGGRDRLSLARFQVQDVPETSVRRILQQQCGEEISEELPGGDMGILGMNSSKTKMRDMYLGDFSCIQ